MVDFGTFADSCFAVGHSFADNSDDDSYYDGRCCYSESDNEDESERPKKVLNIRRRYQEFVIVQKLNDDRKSNKHCDVLIKVCDGEIYAHRAVLSTESDYFDVMFSHDTKERQSGVVEFKDMEFLSVKKCIDFIYTGKLTMNEEEWEDILYVARMMLLSSVCRKIEDFLRESLTLSTYFRIKKLASSFDFEELSLYCDDYAAEILDLVMEEEDFGSLEFDYILYLYRKRGKVNEDLKMELLLRWAKYDLENRRQYFPQICDVLNVGILADTFRDSCVESDPLFSGCTDFVEIINRRSLELDQFMDSLDCDTAMLAYASDADSSISAIVVLDTLYKCLVLYQPSTHKWYKEFTLHKDMVRYRHTDHYTAVAVANYLYVLSSDGKFYRIFCFNGVVEWEKLKSSPQVYKQNICAAVCGEVIYVSGGHQMGCYNITKMEWEELDKGPAVSACSTLVECSDCIYSVGGGVDIKFNSVYRYQYSPQSRWWSSVACMNVARGTPAAVSHTRKIYVAGGCNNGMLDSTECYNPSTDIWTLLSSMITPRFRFKLVIADGKIFAVGSGNIEVYDIETDRWREHFTLPFSAGRQCFATVAIKIPTQNDQRFCRKRSKSNTEDDITPTKRMQVWQ